MSISRIVFIFLAFLVSINTANSQCCLYTLNMQDSYGDGWNGGYLQAYRNDTLLGNFFGEGYGSSAVISVCSQDSLRLVYTPAMYENENFFELYSPGWNLILDAGPDPIPGVIYNAEVNCNATDLAGNHPCTAIQIDTIDCVLGDNIDHASSGLNPNCADFKGGDIWFFLDVPPSGNVSIQTSDGSLSDTGLAAWVDDACTDIRLIACDDDAGNGSYSFLTLYNLNPSQKLFIQIFGYGGAKGTFQLCVKDLGVVTLDSSTLPIISILTLGQTIVDDPKINALMEIRYNGPGVTTYVSDLPNIYNGHIGIEIRGASSAGYPQTPYGLETRDAEGEDLDVSLLGMPEESDWVMISNFNDRSLLRNILSHKLFTSMGQYSPRMQLCEVLLDSMYKGIYLFGEKIKRDKNRVNIANLKPEDTQGDNLTGGYILQQNYWSPSTSFQSNFSPIDHPGLDIHFVYEFPKPEEITTVQKAYIAAFVDTLETALYSSDFADPLIGYRKYLDEKSFIDYFLLNELSRNNDGFKKSVFFHKDRQSKGGKMWAGPGWDFDWAWKNMYGCDVFSAIDGSGWAHHINDCPTDNYSCGWYIRLLQDSSFLSNLKCTYEDYRQTIFNEDFIFNYIDSMGQTVMEAQERHFKKWPILGISGPAPEVNPIATTFEAELDTLKAWISLRLQWLDANMPGLCEMTTSVAQPNSQKDWVRYYPNLTHGRVHFERNTGDNRSLHFILYDITGSVLKTFPIESAKTSFDEEIPAKGIYFFTVSDEYGQMQFGKITRI